MISVLLTKRVGGTLLVLLLHGLLLQALLFGMAPRRSVVAPALLEVALLDPVKPPPEVKPPEPPKLVDKPVPPKAPVIRPRPTPPAPTVSPTTSAEGVAAEPVRDVVREAAPAAPAAAPPQRVAAQVDASSNCQAPRYPNAARMAGESGTVRLLFLISAMGEVEQSRVERSSGYDRLDEAAREALSLCHFTPGTVDGRPERSWTRLDYVWRLK